MFTRINSIINLVYNLDASESVIYDQIHNYMYYHLP